jgi:hypothetical protein
VPALFAFESGLVLGQYGRLTNDSLLTLYPCQDSQLGHLAMSFFVGLPSASSSGGRRHIRFSLLSCHEDAPAKQTYVGMHHESASIRRFSENTVL